MASSHEPPTVETLTRGVLNLLDRFSTSTPPEVPETTPTKAVVKKQQQQQPYQEFILNLKAMSEDSPDTLKSIGHFIESINSSPRSDDAGEDDDGEEDSCEVFASEIKSFTRNKARELVEYDSQLWGGAAVEEHLARLVYSKVHARVFAPTPRHRTRDAALHTKLAGLLPRVMRDPVKSLDLLPSLVPKDEEDEELDALWGKAETACLKLNSCKAPHEKVQCVVNASHVLHSMIRAREEKPIPDVLIPCWVLLLLRANPPSLFSNCEFMSAHHHHPMAGEDNREAAAAMVHFASAVAFLRQCTHESLSMTEEEFGGGGGAVRVVAAPVVAPPPPPSPVVEERESAPVAVSREWIEARAKFEHYQAEDLRLGDVAQLLAEYKLLLRAVARGE